MGFFLSVISFSDARVNSLVLCSMHWDGPRSRLAISSILLGISQLLSVEPRVERTNQSPHSVRSLCLCFRPFRQDSASLKVNLSCTPTDLMELAIRKWLTTHGPEEETLQVQYMLRVSHCLEFLYGDHPLSQYKVSISTSSCGKNPVEICARIVCFGKIMQILNKTLPKSISKRAKGT